MQWKIIKDFEDYKVSNTGAVFSIKRNKMLKPYEKKNYLGVYLYQNNIRKFMTIHRLVALAFIDNPNNYPQINHKDENTKNNCVENLEWCSAKYNSNYGNHRKNLSIALSGENNGFYGKRHTQQTKELLSKLKKGKKSNNTKKIIVNGECYNSMTECAKKIGISLTHLHNIINGKRKNNINIKVEMV
jgi:hypothetical protein